MKRLWWVAVLVTIAFAICFTEIYAIKNSRDTFTKTIEESRIAMENKDYEKAKEIMLFITQKLGGYFCADTVDFKPVVAAK